MLRLISSYHPQTDGQTKRVNQCLEMYLRCFVHACPSQWSRQIALAEFWYNSSMHSSLGRSPFEVLCGYPPRHFGLDVNLLEAVLDLQSSMQNKELMQALVQQYLLHTQARMKRQADKGRSKRSFAVGDQVFLKLQPIRVVFYRTPFQQQTVIQVFRAFQDPATHRRSCLQTGVAILCSHS